MLDSNCEQQRAHARGGEPITFLAQHARETGALDVVHHQEAGAAGLEIGLHPDDAIAGFSDPAEQYERLRLPQKAFPTFLEQRRVFGRCRYDIQVLPDRKLPRKILFYGERLLQQVARKIGDAEPAAAKHALDAITIDGGAVRQGIAGPRRLTPAGDCAHAHEFAATTPVAPSVRRSRWSPGVPWVQLRPPARFSRPFGSRIFNSVCETRSISRSPRSRVSVRLTVSMVKPR